MVEREWRTLDSAAKKVWRVKGIIIFGMIWIFLSLATLLGWYYTPTSDPSKDIPLWIFLIGTGTLVSFFIVYNIWIVMYFPRYRYTLGKRGYSFIEGSGGSTGELSRMQEYNISVLIKVLLNRCFIFIE